MSSEHSLWRSLRLHGNEANAFSDLHDMAKQSDLVLGGRFTSVVGTRELKGDAEDDRLYFIEMRLTVDQGLTPSGVNAVTVEFILPFALTHADATKAADEVAAEMPGPRLVAFLHNKADRRSDYRLSSAAGLFEESDNNIVAPLEDREEHEAARFASETSGLRSLEELVGYIDETPTSSTTATR